MSAFLLTKTTGFMKILLWKVSPPCVAHIYNQITHRFHKLTCMAQVLWHLKFCSQVFTYVNSVWLNQLFRFLTSCIILKCSTADKKTTWFNNCITDRGHVCWRGSTVSSGTKHRHVATCINDLEILWYKRGGAPCAPAGRWLRRVSDKATFSQPKLLRDVMILQRKSNDYLGWLAPLTRENNTNLSGSFVTSMTSSPR